jgi:hypothetical protein
MLVKLKKEFFFSTPQGDVFATDYAGFWGSTTPSGLLFYEVNNGELDDWQPQDWQEFAQVCLATAKPLDYRLPEEAEDIYWLGRLANWALDNCVGEN